MKRFLDQWWAPVFSHVLAVVLTGFSTVFLVATFSSRVTLMGFIILAGVYLPLLLVKFHGASYKLALAIQVYCALGAYFFRPTEIMGNWKNQYVSHLFIVASVCFVLCGLLQALYLKRKVNTETFNRYE